MTLSLLIAGAIYLSNPGGLAREIGWFYIAWWSLAGVMPFASVIGVFICRTDYLWMMVWILYALIWVIINVFKLITLIIPT